MFILGLTGERHVGKSSIVKHLNAYYGFKTAHSFNPGKVMFAAYLKHKRVPDDIAYEMIHGKLKDTPSPYLPNNATPRFFMEKFGYFMGVELGPEYTLGVELDLLSSMESATKVVLDSVVYEVPLVRKNNGIIIRIERPDDANSHIDAPQTSAFQKNIVPDITIVNDGTLSELYDKVIEVIAPHV